MISAKSLRLHNWILDRGIPTQVTMLSIGVTFYSINGVNLDKKTGLTLDDKKEDRFSGIALTSELLRELGFNMTMSGIHAIPLAPPLSSESLHLYKVSTEWRYRIDATLRDESVGSKARHIDDLHELQNLYQDLSKKELSYHPSTISEKTE